MKRIFPWALWFALLATIVLCVMLGGCGSTAPARGSAQDDAIAKQARAATQREAADKAATQAAALSAQAMLDEAAALATRLPADIEKAAQSKAAAIVAKAVADAENATAVNAELAADKARDAGRIERDKDAKAEDARSWASLCRWFGLGALVLGALIGVAVGYLVAPQLGIYLGGGVAGLGMLVVAFGATVTWLPLILAAGIVAALAIWAILHGRQQQVSAALSHALDTVQGKTAATVADAKADLSKVIATSGLAGWFDRLRAEWTVPDPSQAPTVAIVAPELEPQK